MSRRPGRGCRKPRHRVHQSRSWRTRQGRDLHCVRSTGPAPCYLSPGLDRPEVCLAYSVISYEPVLVPASAGISEAISGVPQPVTRS